MGLFDTIGNAANSIANGTSVTDALTVAGEVTLNDAIGGGKITTPAPTPTANVMPAPGQAASPVAVSPGYKVTLPFLGPVPIAIAAGLGLVLAYVGYKYVLKK